jgi:hypothetical protein
VWRGASKSQTDADFDRIMSKVDVVGTSEGRSHHKGPHIRAALQGSGWSYFQGANSDTGIAYNSSKYAALQKHNQRIEGTLWGGKKMTNTVPYMLLQDKETGAKFWVMSAHTQVHGYKGGAQGAVMRKQYQQINSLYSRLEDTGAPVFLVGDLNNPRALQSGIAPKGTKEFSTAIDYVVYRPGDSQFAGGGSMKGIGFDHRRDRGDGPMNSDHPFVYANFNLPGFKAPGGGGGGGGTGGSGGTPDAVSDPYRPGGGVGQWRDEVIWVLNRMKIKPTKSIVDRVLMQMNSESSGKPGIVNKWDSNWQAGHPSVGLMQVIRGTFDAYAGPYKNLGQKKYGVSTHPIANIYAAINYAIDRYGSIGNAFQGHGYEMGSWGIREDQDTRVHKGEMILPSKIADVVREELTAPGIRDNLGRTKAGGRGVEVNFQPGSIVVQMGGGASKQEAAKAGRWIMDAIVDDQRWQSLAEGG